MGFSLQGSIKANLPLFFITSCSDNIWVSVLNGASCLKQPFLDGWKEAVCLGGSVTVHIPQRLLYSWLLMLHCGRGGEASVSVCLHETAEWTVTVSPSLWKDSAKLIRVWTGQCVCVHAVTLPLIQLSKLLRDVRHWQGFHSTVLDTQTHKALSVSACLPHSRTPTLTTHRCLSPLIHMKV